ncbi:MAG: methylenetetrahydrofolate--tRNA-(uracil(54)-C(5))-methyltransferase (FADH(2)-oxidizing) TrmFO [Clostridia bacterium]|nr:methylenetetrahydrofolate--tRNA-(uracil(54)-C(5))-methyltransferase (FADH(2)-oxidizing) TrmFO [Clostridia bacterium]
MQKVSIIGAGLAGCEACYQLAKRGVNVDLYDIKPSKMTPAHSNPNFAEIVCSNSLKSTDLSTASGVLKEELTLLDSLILKTAKECSVPAGSALAVDRDLFAEKITKTIKSFKNVNFISKEVTSLPDGIVILATGPLTTNNLANDLAKTFNLDSLYFYDASSPIVEYSSIDKNNSFIKDRYDKGSGDYLNCPMTKEEYLAFYNELINAKTVELKSFEKKEIFEGCMPIEVMTKRGEDSLRYGPLKPVGLNHPITNEKYYAVVQLRREDNNQNLFNLVGFQTNLTFGEQKRVFSLIPGLKNANFVKYGVMHRNTYINAPNILLDTFQTKQNKNLFVAGQLSGVEGYMESTASGLISGINAYLLLNKKNPISLNKNTMLGAIANFITNTNSKNFQPMNANFGILPPLEVKERDDKKRKLLYAERAIDCLKNQLQEYKEDL